MRFITLFASTPLTLVLLALIIATCTLPMYIPDSYEQALGFICRFQEHPSCIQSNLYFRPPSMSLFLAPFSIGMSPFLAVGVLSMLCSAWSILPIAWSIKQQTHSNTMMWCGVLAFLSAPTILILNSLADARIFVLPFLFASWACLFIDNPKRYQLISSGLCMGIAGTTRPELLLGIILISLFSWFLYKKKAFWTIASAWTPYLIWIATLSVQAQRLVLGPRHWEGALLSIWEFIPKRMALRLYGMGMYDPPARAIPSEIPTTQTLDIVSGFAWLFQIISMTPLVFIIGLSMMIASWRTHKKAVCISIAICLPYVAAAFLPQARAPLFPQANMIPVLMIMYCYTGMAVGRALVHSKIPIIGRILFPAGVICAHLLTVYFPDRPDGIEYTPSGIQAQRFLRDQSQSSYTSSYENASLVWLSKKQWHQQNSVWDKPQSRLILRSSIDMDVIPNEKPIAFWAYEDNWVLISQSDLDKRD